MLAPGWMLHINTQIKTNSVLNAQCLNSKIILRKINDLFENKMVHHTFLINYDTYETEIHNEK
jgi:hypothetical protein